MECDVTRYKQTVEQRTANGKQKSLCIKLRRRGGTRRRPKHDNKNGYREKGKGGEASRRLEMVLLFRVGITRS